ncbi:hypothetical protein LPL18_012930 [Halomonas sp. CUBES01]|uniref:Integral membrane protein n=1 Tax=Vreelandella gomseomensis TaxID=370766 RepID=A0ABU1G7L4_9GAMM|nr:MULTISPECIES: hypothetical protein [Halomonas]MDR5873475.1 hypothetical protein [Halomonas gomseomensis]MEC4768232.1 hypothetical protein [Halomonas sp. CUBES01]
MSDTPRAWPLGFRTTLIKAILYVLGIGAIAQGAFLEALYLPDVRFSELGFTELTQTLTLAVSCGLLLYVRHILKVWPTVTLLLLAFIGASLVREQDAFLDQYIADDTWQIIVALIVVPSLAWVVMQRRRFLDEFAHYSNSFSFGLFTAGVLTTYIFSRLYGRQDFWRAVLQDHFVREFKDVAEEVVELLGYSLILVAMIELMLLARRVHKARLAHA